MDEHIVKTKDETMTVATTAETEKGVDDLLSALTFLEAAPASPVMAAVPADDSSAQKIAAAVRALKTVQEVVAEALRVLDAPAGEDMAPASFETKTRRLAPTTKTPAGRVIEGVFDGRGMVGPDGQEYSVPPNYASKSKLVEGDMMKLTITPTGAFIYKQIGPVERERVAASLGFDETTGEFYGASSDKRWSVLRASVTYFKGEAGDEVVLLVPKGATSAWAAVENIVKAG